MSEPREGTQINFLIPNATKAIATLVVFEDAKGSIRSTLRISPSKYDDGECINLLLEALMDAVRQHTQRRISEGMMALILPRVES